MDKQKKKLLDKTIARIEGEVRDEKFLERQALYYIKKQTPVIDLDVIQAAPKELVEEIKKQEVAFEPNSDKQTAFIEASEDHVLFGGGRAGGKTEAFIADPLRCVDHSKFRALVLRKNIPDLRDLISRAQVMYRKLYPQVQWKVKENMFVFPSGATIEYGHLETETDVDKYHGQQYTWIGIDEISQVPEYNWFSKLLGSLRTVDNNLKAYFRATTNWTGVGAVWVKDYFKVEEVQPNTTIYEHGTIHINGKTIETVLTKKWLNSTIFDNPAKRDDHSYLAYLNSQPEYIKRAWLYGETGVIEGSAFPEFNREIHIVPHFIISDNWKRFRGGDYGYGDGASCVWIAVAPDGTHYVYREFVVNGRSSTKKYTAIEWAQNVVELELNEFVRYGILDSSLWNSYGDSGPSMAEQMLKVGLSWRKADKSKGSRIAGKNKIHQMLQVNETTKKPKLIVFDTCINTIKTMYGIPVDKNNAEDVDTDSPLDHTYDALRYIISSRIGPNGSGFHSGENKPIIYNSEFLG